MDPEYEAIRQSLPTLKDFLIHCPHAAADEFFAKDLIPEELKRKVYSDPEKVGELILGSICKNGPTIRTVRCSLFGQLGACFSDLRDLLFGH